MQNSGRGRQIYASKSIIKRKHPQFIFPSKLSVLGKQFFEATANVWEAEKNA
jgi:hypothetical protein